MWTVFIDLINICDTMKSYREEERRGWWGVEGRERKGVCVFVPTCACTYTHMTVILKPECSSEQPRSLGKHGCLGSTPRFSDSVGLGGA